MIIKFMGELFLKNIETLSEINIIYNTNPDKLKGYC